jgi:hypothetical protein
MAPHGKSAIFVPENHPNRKSSASELISGVQARVMAP